MTKQKSTKKGQKNSRSAAAVSHSEKASINNADTISQNSEVIGAMEPNTENLLNILNKMNTNLIDYIQKNNEYIFTAIDESKRSSETAIKEKWGQVHQAMGDIRDAVSNKIEANNETIMETIENKIAEVKADEATVGEMIAAAIEANNTSLMKIISEKSSQRATMSSFFGGTIENKSPEMDIEKYVSEAIKDNNESLLKILEENSSSLVQLLGQSNLEWTRELNQSNLKWTRELAEREQHQLETIVRRKSPSAPKPVEPGTVLPEVINPLSITEAMDRLRELAPLSYDSYMKCLDTGTESYQDLPEVSCSTERHPQARLFHDFLQPYLRNNVLDVGCGPQPVPSYLTGWPHENIVGIDPISEPDDHPFKFISGIGEFLPFPDNSFGTVVSGTTLDHYYLLDLGLKEAFRVLEPGGHFVAWITEFEGAPEYDPYNSDVTPFDHEHMYHIDRKWFLPLMQSIGFEVGEIIRFPLPFNYLFMSFQKPE